MTFDIDRVELLLVIAAIVAMLARRLRLPYTVGLTLAGVVLAMARSGFDIHASFDVHLSKELIFTAFLPPLIFEAAFHIEWRALRTDALVVLTLATLGVLVSSAVAVVGLHYLAAWPWAAALLLGLLISATDPVSVIATFKEAGVTGRLRLLVESESLFNDGTVAVLYSVALVTAAGQTPTVAGVTSGVLLTIAGGLTCGALVGGAVILLAGRTEDHLIEITFSTVAAYGSFLLAEHFHLSGVLATLTAGLLVGNTGSLGAFSDRGREAVQSFWEYLGFVANSLIFLLIGIRLVAEDVLGVLAVALLVVILATVGRGAAVYACCGLFAGSARRVSMSHQHLLVWGGLRGALALALALGLPSGVPKRDAIASVAFAVVAFSVVVQGLTITPLLRRLGELAPLRQPEVSR